MAETNRLSARDRNKIFAATFSGAAFILLVSAASGENSPLILLGRPIVLVFLGVLAYRGSRIALRFLSLWFAAIAVAMIGALFGGGATGMGVMVAIWTAFLLGFWAVRLWQIKPGAVEEETLAKIEDAQ
jgi:hypothetical protein